MLRCLLLILGSGTCCLAQNYNLVLRSKVTFPNEPIAGVWGYEQNGREYALVAGEKNLHIIEVTNPDLPKKIVSLPMANDWGKEVRTFRHYAYVSAESGAGLVIYDLHNLPSALPAAYPKKEIGQAGGDATYGHTLHIDTTTATLYLNSSGGNHTWLFSLLPTPFAPTFAGFYQEFGNFMMATPTGILCLPRISTTVLWPSWMCTTKPIRKCCKPLKPPADSPTIPG